MFNEIEAAALYKKGYRVTVITDTVRPRVVSHHKSEIGALTKVVNGYGMAVLWLKESGFVRADGNAQGLRERLSYLRREARN